VGRCALGLLAAIALAAPALAQDAPPPADGLHTQPSIFWKSGDHRVDLNFAARLRTEIWDAFADDVEAYTGLRTRVRLTYGWRERLVLVAEMQNVSLWGMDPEGSGAIASYRNANEGERNVSGTDLHLLYAELRPWKGAYLRVGRQEMKLGPEVLYAEPDWRYLKAQRIGERLLGTVGWSHVERAGDGVSANWDLGGHNLFALAARPTQGVLAVQTGYRPLRDVRYAGGSWTVKRDTWLPHTELGVFGLAYEDERSPGEGGLAQGLEIYTLGIYELGVHPLGPGKLDTMLWFAGQFGDYNDLDHRGYAFLAELGYQLPDLPAKPWLRGGVNYASGDGDPTDGDHDTFFNLLPTNHLYSGFIDQVEFQNLIDAFVQLKLTPVAPVAVNFFVHWLWLANDDDARYAGSGAFDRKSFGFPATPSRGYKHIGLEYDLVATWTVHKTTTVELGVSYLDGGNIFRRNASSDAVYGYASIEFKY
jgi:hypothetical protein